MSDLTDQDLYGPTGKPDAADIHQRNLGDCYFVAPLGALATQQPERIQDAIAYNAETKSFTVTLYQHGHGGFLGLSDEAKPVKIEISQAELQADMKVSDNLTHGPANARGPIWPAVMEAAYAEQQERQGEGMVQGLSRIGGGGYPKNAIYALTGEQPNRVSAHDAKSVPVDQMYDRLNGALQEGRPVLLSTNYMKDVPNDGLIKGDGNSGHVYMVEGATKDAAGNVELTLRNPWGHNIAPGMGINSPNPITKVDLKTVLENGHVDELAIGPKPPHRTQDKDQTQQQGHDGSPKQAPSQVQTGDPAMDHLLASLNDPKAMDQALSSLAQSPEGQAFHAQGQAQYQAMEAQQAQQAQVQQQQEPEAPTGPVMVR